jgi:hypothetical protein
MPNMPNAAITTPVEAAVHKRRKFIADLSSRANRARTILQLCFFRHYSRVTVVRANFGNFLANSTVLHSERRKAISA